MSFKCMRFKANYFTSSKPKKEKPPQVVCLKYISNSEFDDLSNPPLPNNNYSSKPIKIKPTTPKPEVLSIFNVPPPPPNEIIPEPEPEEIKPVEPPKSILKVTNRNENSQVEVPSSTTPPNDTNPSLTYSTENSFQTNDNPVENEQEEVLSSFTTEQEEVPSSSTTQQEEVPSSYTTEQEEVSPSHESKQVEILKKEEQEEIISSEDDISQNSQYKVRFAKKPKPNYELKSNEESEISDYESEDEDLDLDDNNNNRDAYSSQAESIFFAGVEAELSPRINKLPKYDDEV